MELCTNYKFKWWHLFLPSPDIIYQPCVSYDKTDIFLVSLTRAVLIIVLFMSLSGNGKIKFDDDELHRFIYSLLLVFMLFNIIIVVTVVFKQNLMPKTDDKPDVTPQEIKNYQISQDEIGRDLTLLENRAPIFDQTIIRVNKPKDVDKPVGFN